MAEINPKLVKWDDQKINPAFVSWDKETEPTIGERAARVAGLGARAVATGVPPIGLGLALGEGLNQAYNLATGSNRSGVFQGWNTFLTQAGLPEPQTPAERVSSAIISGMAGMGGQVGLLQQARPAAQSAQELIRQQLVQQPGRQVVAGGTSGAGSSLAAEAGAGPVGQTVAGVVSGMAPFAGQMIFKPSPELTRTAQVSQRAIEAGYRLPPTQAGGGLTNAVLEGYVAGKAPTDRTLAIKNQGTTDRLAKNALDFPQDRPLTFDNLAQYRQVTSEPYREASRLGTDVSKMVTDLSEARFNANAQYRFYDMQGDPAVLAQAKTFEAQANALEAGIETAARNAGKMDLISRLRKSREQIAKSYTIERALDDTTGHVQANIIGKEVSEGKPVSGQLRIIGQTSNVYRPALRTPEQVGSPAGRDVLGTYLGLLGAGGGMSAATQNPYWMAAAALPIMRPAARSLITSRPYQSIMVNPQTQPLSQSTAGILGLAPSLYQ